MIKIVVSYARGKDFERENVIKVAYTDESGAESVVEGNDILTHRFPLTRELQVYSTDGSSTASCNGIRSISAFNVDDEL